jgi:hypothetical protein
VVSHSTCDDPSRFFANRKVRVIFQNLMGEFFGQLCIEPGHRPQCVRTDERLRVASNAFSERGHGRRAFDIRGGDSSISQQSTTFGARKRSAAKSSAKPLVSRYRKQFDEIEPLPDSRFRSEFSPERV